MLVLLWGVLYCLEWLVVCIEVWCVIYIAKFADCSWFCLLVFGIAVDGVCSVFRG